MASLASWLRQAPFTLCMSSSFCGWYAHLGVLEALLEAGLIPQKVSGASAGAIMSAAFASGMPLEKVKAIMLSLRRVDLARLSFLEGPPAWGLLQVRPDNPLVSALPVSTLEDCPRCPISVSCFSLSEGRTKVFRKGNLGEVVTASCSVPGLVPPASITGETGSFFDGGVRDIGGLAGCDAPNERVLYHHCTVAPISMATGHGRFRDEDLTTLQISGLPVVTPFTLHRGLEMYVAARDATRRALQSARDRPVVRVQAAAVGPEAAAAAAAAAAAVTPPAAHAPQPHLRSRL